MRVRLALAAALIAAGSAAAPARAADPPAWFAPIAPFRIAGPKTNLAFHADLLTSTEFVSGDYDTSLVSKLRPTSR